MINIQGERDRSGRLALELPKIYFDRRFNYKVCVHKIHIVLDHNEKLPDLELLCLNSNLIDRSGANLTQSLVEFWNFSKRKLSQIFTAQVLCYHSLHLYEIENSTFEVIRVFSNRSVSVEKLFVQLEIVKIDPYGRFQ